MICFFSVMQNRQRMVQEPRMIQNRKRIRNRKMKNRQGRNVNR